MPGVFGLHTCYRTLFRQPDTNRQCPLRTVCRLGGDENTNDTLRRKYLYAFDPRLHCLQGVRCLSHLYTDPASAYFLFHSLSIRRLFSTCSAPMPLRKPLLSQKRHRLRGIFQAQEKSTCRSITACKRGGN